MKIAAIDLGQSGCVCLYDTDENKIVLADIEIIDDKSLNTPWLLDLLMKFTPAVITIERVFKPACLIRMAGEVQAVAKLMGVELKVVAPVTWMKAMLNTNKSNKKESIKLCRKLAPKVNLKRKMKRKETDSHDRAESVLLALYTKTIV